MSIQELKALLDDVPDTREIVLRREPGRRTELELWRDAEDDAARALRTWSRTPGRAAYAAYRAAQDRADAAQDAYSQTSRSRVS
jgi:hypothetical protein